MIDRLLEAVGADAAIRRVRRLQPAGGRGDKIFPPTYPGDGQNSPPRHVFETRRINGDDTRCVLIDSVQSQANRLEEALLAAAREGRISLPRIVVDFAGTDVADIGEISSLDAPHRVFDAILRDSDLDGSPFRDTQTGRRLVEAKANAATALFETSPADLVFGAWNSTGQGGGLGAKFARCVVSEIVGIGVAETVRLDHREVRTRRRGDDIVTTERVEIVREPSGARTSSRIDPLGISKDVKVVGDQKSWEIAGDKAKNVKRPSEINHSNIAPGVVEGLGVTIDYALHTAVLTLAGLRRLSFPDQSGRVTAERNAAARAALAALGLVALVEQERQGFALRSRCDLVGDSDAPETQRGRLELVRTDGTADPLSLDADEATALLSAAVERAAAQGLDWSEKPLGLKPQKRLVELVRLSRDRALADEGGQEADD